MWTTAPAVVLSILAATFPLTFFAAIILIRKSDRPVRVEVDLVRLRFSIEFRNDDEKQEVAQPEKKSEGRRFRLFLFWRKS